MGPMSPISPIPSPQARGETVGGERSARRQLLIIALDRLLISRHGIARRLIQHPATDHALTRQTRLEAGLWLLKHADRLAQLVQHLALLPEQLRIGLLFQSLEVGLQLGDHLIE